MSSSNGLRIGLIAAIFLLITKGAVVRGQIPGPNAVVSMNGQTMLDCVVVQITATTWSRTTDGISDFLQIASGCSVSGINTAYYSTTQPGGNVCRLTIGNATMQQAGVYKCFDGLAAVYNSLVTVIDPVTNVVVHNQYEIVEGDQLNISCSINYNGPSLPAPSIRPSPYFTSPGQSFTSLTYYPSANIATVVATIRVQKPKVPIFQCNTVFEITGNTTGYNATAPSDNIPLGATTELDVQYGPSKPAVKTNKSEVITINGVACGINVLTCSSTGNPTPNYTWYDSVYMNVIVSTGETLTLGEIHRNYTCQAYNKINVLSTTFNVSDAHCISTGECCVYPRDDTTSIAVEGCDNGTLCDCSQGSSGIKLVCSAKTFPNASYMWNGPNGQVVHSPVYDQVNMNGTYRCNAYFDRTLSNYSGDVIFSNGSNEKTVDQCSVPPSTTPSVVSESTATITTTGSTTAWSSGDNCHVSVAAAIAVGAILFISLALNIMLLIIMIKNMRPKHDPFKRAGTSRTILSPETLDLSNEPPAPATYEELTRSNEIHLQPTYDKLTPKPPAPATYQELTHPNEIHLQPPTYEKLATKPSSYVDDLS